MKLFLKLGTYIFHPLSMPLWGALLYFWVTPRFFPPSIIEAKLLAIVMLSLFIPLTFVFFLRNISIARTQSLRPLRNRRIILLFLALLLLTLNNFVLNDQLPELIYYFEGMLLSIVLILGLSFSSYQAGLHMAGISALYGFIIGMSLLYHLNLIVLIAVLTFGLGWVASSQIKHKNSSSGKNWIGFFIGILPQVLFFILAFQHYKR